VTTALGAAGNKKRAAEEAPPTGDSASVEPPGAAAGGVEGGSKELGSTKKRRKQEEWAKKKEAGKGGCGGSGGSASAASSFSGHSPHALFDRTSGQGTTVADLMGGVGPFAVPLALRGARVHANDLNPDSYAWLSHNVTLNRVANLVHPYCMDGRRFVAVLRGRTPVPPIPPTALLAAAQAAAASSSLMATSTTPLSSSSFASSPPSPPNATGDDGDDKKKEVWLEPVWFEHAIMNLPQTAIEFLDAFRGFLYTRPRPSGKRGPTTAENEEEEEEEEEGVAPALAAGGLVLEEVGETRKLPMIHVYCFEKELDGDPDAAPRNAIARCVAALGGVGAPASLLPRDQVDVHVVRYVSPQKPMLCLSFRLPFAVASAPPLEFPV